MSRSILIVGDIMLDKTTHADVVGPSPEASNVLVVRERGRPMYNLGGAANVAANIAALGGDVSLLGALGYDAEAIRVRRLLSETPVKARTVSLSRPTTVKHRIVTPGGQILRIDHEETSPISWSGPYGLRSHFKEMLALDRGMVIVFVDYNKGVFGEWRDYAENYALGEEPSSRFGYHTLVDPGNRVIRSGWLGTVAKLNFHQALLQLDDLRKRLWMEGKERGGLVCAETGKVDIACLYAEFGRLVHGALRDRNVFFGYLWITLGRAGAVLVPYGDPGRSRHFPALPVSSPDPCGAGDTALAVMAVELAHEGLLSEERLACHVLEANLGAAIAVSHPGVHVLTRKELYGEDLHSN